MCTFHCRSSSVLTLSLNMQYHGCTPCFPVISYFSPQVKNSQIKIFLIVLTFFFSRIILMRLFNMSDCNIIFHKYLRVMTYTVINMTHKSVYFTICLLMTYSAFTISLALNFLWPKKFLVINLVGPDFGILFQKSKLGL